MSVMQDKTNKHLLDALHIFLIRPPGHVIRVHKHTCTYCKCKSLIQNHTVPISHFCFDSQSRCTASHIKEPQNAEHACFTEHHINHSRSTSGTQQGLQMRLQQRVQLKAARCHCNGRWSSASLSTRGPLSHVRASEASAGGGGAY